MNTSRLQLIIEEMVEDIKDNPTLLSLLGELVEEISTTYNVPSNWKDIGSNLEETYRGNTDIYDYMSLEDYRDE